MSGGQMVTVIDDDESVRKALCRLLAAGGLTVRAFGSAEEFLDSGSQHDSQCVVLDLNLPGMSGLELQHWLSGECPQVSVIVISACRDEHVRQQSL